MLLFKVHAKKGSRFRKPVQIRRPGTAPRRRATPADLRRLLGDATYTPKGTP